MPVTSINSSPTPPPAQEQQRPARAPRSEESRPAEEVAETRRPQQSRPPEAAESARKPEPVVNSEGQTTGRVINETA